MFGTKTSNTIMCFKCFYLYFYVMFYMSACWKHKPMLENFVQDVSLTYLTNTFIILLFLS